MSMDTRAEQHIWRMRGYRKGNDWYEQYKWFAELNLATITFTFTHIKVANYLLIPKWLSNRRVIESGGYSIGEYKYTKDISYHDIGIHRENEIKFNLLKELYEIQYKINSLKGSTTLDRHPLEAGLYGYYELIETLWESAQCKCKCCCCKCKCK